MQRTQNQLAYTISRAPIPWLRSQLTVTIELEELEWDVWQVVIGWQVGFNGLDDLMQQSL